MGFEKKKNGLGMFRFGFVQNIQYPKQNDPVSVSLVQVAIKKRSYVHKAQHAGVIVCAVEAAAVCSLVGIIGAVGAT